MSVVLMLGQELTKNDLKIFITDDQNNYLNPYRIMYTIYRVISDKFNNQECAEEPILETINSPGVPFGIGKFFAAWVMPTDTNTGPYRIKWDISKNIDTPSLQKVQEFEIVIRSFLEADAKGTSGRNGPYPHVIYGDGCREGK